MTDKVQKIREEVERLKEWQPIATPSLNKILSLLDSMQEEPIKDRFVFKAIPRLLEMIEPTDRAKTYTAKLADTLEVEGYSTDAKIVRESLKIMNGEKVPMATMDEEPVSEELEEAAKEYSGKSSHPLNNAFKAGAKWQEKQDQSTIELAEDHAMLAGMEKMKEQMMANIWKPADGDDLPDFDREVIVLTQHYPLEGSEYAVYFAHRPNPDGWDGKSIATGEVEHYIPKTYDKGGWNIPDVKYWLDIIFPNK